MCCSAWKTEDALFWFFHWVKSWTRKEGVSLLLLVRREEGLFDLGAPHTRVGFNNSSTRSPTLSQSPPSCLLACCADARRRGVKKNSNRSSWWRRSQGFRDQFTVCATTLWHLHYIRSSNDTISQKETYRSLFSFAAEKGSSIPVYRPGGKEIICRVSPAIYPVFRVRHTIDSFSGGLKGFPPIDRSHPSVFLLYMKRPRDRKEDRGRSWWSKDNWWTPLHRR